MIGITDFDLEKTIQILTDKQDDEFDSGDDEIPENVGLTLQEAATDSGLSSYKSILESPADAVLEEIRDQLGANFDINSDLYSNGKKKRGKKVMPKTLPSHLSELFGNANLAYTLGNYAEAVHLLNNIIKECPTSPQPWLQLAMIHDELGDPTKALQVYLVAAHLTRKDADLWKRLGSMFKSLGDNDQAIYCLTKAIRLNSQDTDSLWERALAYREEGFFEKAILGLQEILKIFPNDPLTVKELTEVYVQINDNQSGLEIFESMMNAMIQEDMQSDFNSFDDCEVVGHYSMGIIAPTNSFNIGFEEVNTLVDLYISISDFQKAADSIILWVQKLKGIQFLDPLRLDEDFHNEVDIPIELRVKLGICRMYQGSIDTAKLHFQRLMTPPFNQLTDLFAAVADSFILHHNYYDALSFLEIYEQGNSLNHNAIWNRTAKCYYELGNPEAAMNICISGNYNYFTSALENTPTDIDSKMMLAVINEDMGNTDIAKQLTDEVELIVRERQIEARNKSMSKKQKATNEARKIDKMQLMQEEKQKIVEARELYEKITSLLPLTESNMVVRKDCLRYMRKLVSRFTSTTDFYPTERSKEFSGLSSLRSLKRVTDPMVFEILETNTFQGISFDDWYQIFVKHAQLSTFDEKHEEAQETLKAAFDSSVFFHDEEKRVALKLHMIAAAIRASNFGIVSESCRYLLNYRQLTNDMYHLFIACLSRGYGVLEFFASQHNQRYFIRNMKVLEKDAKKSRSLEFKNPVLYTLHGHISTCARSYLDALNYYMKAYKLAPKDPLINLCLGIAHLHRGMQRKASDRHEHIACAFMFLQQYQELCTRKLESFYNIGRAFHHIGLYHLAIQSYEKGLAIGSTSEQSNLCHEIAYNLSLIYCQSGSYLLAREILKKYNTFR